MPEERNRAPAGRGKELDSSRETAEREDQARHARSIDDGRRGEAQAIAVPKYHKPPPGSCRVWFPGRPAGQHPRPTAATWTGHPGRC